LPIFPGESGQGRVSQGLTENRRQVTVMRRESNDRTRCCQGVSNMKIDPNVFLNLSPDGQVKYLETGDYGEFTPQEQIEFLKRILKEDLPPATISCALSLLTRLNYPDRFFFRKFLYHRNNAVVKAAKKAMEALRSRKNQEITLVDILKEGESNDRILLANYFLEQKGKVDENALISFLQVDDLKVREVIVRKISPDHEIDEALLSQAINKGVAWYVRAALVEILGNRKSKHLFDRIDFLMKDTNVEVKLKLIDALSKWGEEEGKAYLQKLSHDAIIWVRKQAHQALEKL
jgi:hypothetical protein